jgi:hypothetical protein
MKLDQALAGIMTDTFNFSAIKKVTEIEPKAVSKLTKYGACYLNLESLLTLDLEVATVISKHVGAISLDKLTELKDLCAEQLGKHKGYLSLNGIRAIDENIAIHLSKHKKNELFNNLYLNGLIKIDSATADALSNFKGKLFLHGIKEPDPVVLNKLVSKTCSLSLQQINSLSKTFCESLVGPKVKGSLHLDSVRQVDPLAAESLTKVKGGVSLSGLLEINSELAKPLAKITKTLSLNGIKSLDENTAFELFKTKANLSLNGLSEINPQVCEQLLNHFGSNKDHYQKIELLGLKEISKDFAKKLAEARDFEWRLHNRVKKNIPAYIVRKLENNIPYPFKN